MTDTVPPSEQLVLPVNRAFEPSFDNYFLPENSPNLEVVTKVYAMVQGRGDQVAYVWGPAQVGLSHLWAASSQVVAQRRAPLIQLALKPDRRCLERLLSLRSVAANAVLCVDDVDAIAGFPDWEQALFHLFNRGLDAGATMIFVSHSSPQSLAIELPDLRSRLLSGVSYQLKPLADTDKVQALQLQAHRLGMLLGEDEAWYIVNHTPRGLRPLFSLLESLDRETLKRQRRLTVPFIKEILAAKG